MELLKVYSREEIFSRVRNRAGEEKLGDKIVTVIGDWKKFLKDSQARFVIIGVPEDIGVRANHGRAGASTAVKPAIDSFLNQQCNVFIDAREIIMLGELFVSDLMEAASTLDAHDQNDLRSLRELVVEVDKRLSEVIKIIIAAKKIPVIIGGGHNNAFGNIKGAFDATNKKINVINCDPHLDFRPLEGRHSGNGFSYAYGSGFINRYSVFGMHEQYNSNHTITKFREDPSHLFFHTYENIFVREEIEFKIALAQCIGFVKDFPCGIELDLDAITNVPSSAKTSSGISALQARQYIHGCASQLEPLYLHIAEGAPVLSHIKADNKTGKLISYLITDFIKGCGKNA